MSDNNKTSLTKSLKNSASRLGLRALEPRILLDAAGFVTGADVAMEVLDTQSVAEDMAAIFEATETSLAPRGELSEVETLLRDLNAVDSEGLDADLENKELTPAIIDDGGKNYDVKTIGPVVTDGEGKDYGLKEQVPVVTDDGGKNYHLSATSFENTISTVSLNDDGNFEIHSGETINVDIRANDTGGGDFIGIMSWR